MKHARKFLVLSLLCLAACAVDPSEDPITSPSEQSLAAIETAPGTGPITQTVTCTKVWQCDLVCPRFFQGQTVFFPANVLHEECSDGSDRVLQTRPCGEDCF